MSSSSFFYIYTPWKLRKGLSSNHQFSGAFAASFRESNYKPADTGVNFELTRSFWCFIKNLG